MVVQATPYDSIDHSALVETVNSQQKKKTAEISAC
jgi:hypothetical protein